MILAIDIGNSAIKIGIFDNGKMTDSFSISSLTDRTKDEYVGLISGVVNGRAVDATVLASVVPSLTERISAAAEIVSGRRTLRVGRGIKTGIEIRTDNQTEVGADIVANCVGARGLSEGPFIVADLGTAGTLTLVDGKNAITGVIILPGIGSQLESLKKNCANLPLVGLTEPRTLLGKNTADSVVSGIVNGYSAMLDGLVDRIRDEYSVREAKVFACGGYAQTVCPRCKTEFKIVPELTLIGLNHIGLLNK